MSAIGEGLGPKTASVADVDITLIYNQLESFPQNLDELHPYHEAVDADRFDLRMEALNDTEAPA